MANSLDLRYNSESEDIKMPEYGRSIQELINYALTIADDKERQATAETIASMMATLNPSTRSSNADDYKDRIWNHMFRIAEHKLNVKVPHGVSIISKEDRKRPEPVAYPPNTTRFRHYGHNIQALIAKAIKMEDGPKKDGFKEVIASYMKLAYKTWNREHYVSDDIVKDDLESLSNGKLSIADGHNSLDYLAASAVIKDNRRRSERNHDRRQSGGSTARNKGRKRSFTNKNRKQR